MKSKKNNYFFKLFGYKLDYNQGRKEIKDGEGTQDRATFSGFFLFAFKVAE